MTRSTPGNRPRRSRSSHWRAGRSGNHQIRFGGRPRGKGPAHSWHLAARPTHPSWMNGYGKLRHCTDKRKVIVEFWLCLAAAFTVIRRLINRARNRYRWPTRPTTRRLR
jgi:hypothetical protein